MAVNDWLPTVGGTILGLAGVYVTLKSGKRQQETAVAVARMQAEHQAQVVREERGQRRRETVYKELSQWVIDTHGYVRKLHEEPAGKKRPDLPDALPPSVGGSEALWWSHEIGVLYQEFRRAVNEFLSRFRSARSAEVGEEKLDLNALNAEFEACTKVLRQILDRMRIELGAHRHHSRP
ncbi:hypothetical protein AB0I28_21375 [Phytomonospora sp. NPDC050363]|uniref:hypothetical protein n=1 Tax=Phytomonospora sp. NPDC050363 TaxID=3155642 RepID=UPI0033D8CFDF